MDSFVNESDFGLLARDRYTFSVLDRILRGNCDLVLTDHRSLILCHSEPPYPVWIWTPDRCPEDAMARAWELACRYRPLQSGYRFNMKYELADFFINKAGEKGLTLAGTTNLFAYDCPDPVAPESTTDGELFQCTTKDLDELVDFYDMFHNAVGIDKQSREQYRIQAEEGIKAGTVFFLEECLRQMCIQLQLASCR